jgi:ATP adenylyltransferase
MDKLWAPWRINYIKASAKKNGGSANTCGGKKQKACIFCKSRTWRAKNYIIVNNRYSFAILNKYPYNNGHILVAPRRHIKDITNLKDAEIIDIFKTLREVKIILTKVLRPNGFNIGINISAVAGAGITGHLHIHIVPRWKGDTNFMPVIYNTKIISQSLDELYKRLKNVNPGRNKRIRK